MSNTNHTNDGGPAFPRDSKWNPDGSLCQRGAVGMTLRDWFATHASEADIEDHLGGEIHPKTGRVFNQLTRAQARYSYADAMIAARNNSPSQP